MNWFSNLFKKKSSEISSYKSKIHIRISSYEKGKQFYNNKQIDEAIHYFNIAIENGYEDDVYDLRADCHQELGNYEESIQDLDKAISLYPNDCNLYFIRSISNHALGNTEEEISDLKKAIDLCMIDDDQNRIYNENAKKMGYKSGVRGLYEINLAGAEMRLTFTKKV